MAVLSKLEITYKDANSTEHSFVFQYNPTKLTIAKEADWTGDTIKGTDLEKRQFNAGKAKTLTLSEILFDTSMTGNKSVYTNHILILEQMLMVQDYKVGDNTVPRPPTLSISWGSGSYFFECILKKISYDIKMFAKDATPIRANVSLDFVEIIPETISTKTLVTQSIKTYTVTSYFDTLHDIALSELGDMGKWKLIATANGIDDPTDLSIGDTLTIPDYN